LGFASVWVAIFDPKIQVELTHPLRLVRVGLCSFSMRRIMSVVYLFKTVKSEWKINS